MKNLKQLRRDVGLSQHALAEAVGLPRWKISHAELRMLELSADEIHLIRKILVTACRKNSARVLADAGEQPGRSGKTGHGTAV